MKRSPMRKSDKPMKQLGNVGKQWQSDRKICKAEWFAIGVTYCVFQYEVCWRDVQGFAHSLKRINRTKPEHDIETVPACNACHEIAERMGVEKMAAEIRRIRSSYGLPTYE